VNSSQFFLAEEQILRVNCAKMARLEIDQDNMGTKFLALNSDFSNLSLDPLGLRRPVQVSIKEVYPLKVVILLLLARLA